MSVSFEEAIFRGRQSGTGHKQTPINKLKLTISMVPY